MSRSVTVKEKKHPFWKAGTLASALLCIILFVIFWNTASPFWSSIFRLGAFIFFALTVMGYLKTMNGPLDITLREEKDYLVVIYEKKGTNIQEEQFDRKTIKNVEVSRTDKRLITSYLLPEAATFKINFTDTDRALYLFEFSGRPLLFDFQSRKEIKTFLENLGIKCKD